MNIGMLIFNYRRDNDLSLQAFADKCGLSKGYIAMLERNVNSKTGEPVVPSIETCIKVSKAMNMTLDSLLKSVDENQPIGLADICKVQNEQAETNDDALFIIEMLKELDPENIKRLRDYADLLALSEKDR